MQFARKFAFVDPHYLEDREYKQVQKQPTSVARGNLSLEIKRILNDTSESDDQKAKRYIDAIRRYTSIRDDYIPIDSAVGFNTQTTPYVAPPPLPPTPPIPPPQLPQATEPRRSTRKSKKKPEVLLRWKTY